MGYRAAVMRIRPAATTRTTGIGLASVAGLLGLVILSGPAGAAGSGVGSSVPGPTGSAPAVLHNSFAAATKAGSARISVQFYSGSTTGKVLQDSSLSSGKQTVAVGKALASIVLVGGTAYISGNSQGLTSYFGIPTALLPQIVGRSISLQQSDSGFQSVTANVTLPSALANVTPSGTLVEGKHANVNGQQVRTISGTGPGGAGRVTLLIASTGRRLPVEAVETSASGTSRSGEIVSFSQWGEQVTVTKPTKVIPISRLQSAAPAQG